MAAASLDLAFNGNGPDVRVWLSDQPVPTTAPFDVFGQGRHLELGAVKGNVGDLVYDIPPAVDLGSYVSVDLPCVRFSVSFALPACARLSGLAVAQRGYRHLP